MATGNLRIQVHTGDDALPIENANVLIKDTFGRVLYNLTTDNSGNTKGVELYAPDKSHNLDPNDPGPYYGVYDVEIRKPNFITEIIRGVQIFDGIDSYLPINLLPSPSPEQELVNVSYIPANNLHSSEPRPQPGPVGPAYSEVRTRNYFNSTSDITYSQMQLQPKYPFTTSESMRIQGDPFTTPELMQTQGNPLITPAPTALQEVIVPDYITVHLGSPSNTSARNIRVKFIDYIKNVASSEIYPDWPNASLRANIHAIVTFALNRIYTEWYRSRGLNFDITNNTGYDMAYVENRNIFQNISNIVDEIFNVYARRIGFRDPFFTEFCNGTTSKCNGMSQWGTVTFANQGMDPLQILRSYYPRDLELVTTNNIGPVQESYPGSPLSIRE